MGENTKIDILGKLKQLKQNI